MTKRLIALLVLIVIGTAGIWAIVAQDESTSTPTAIAALPMMTPVAASATAASATAPAVTSTASAVTPTAPAETPSVAPETSTASAVTPTAPAETPSVAPETATASAVTPTAPAETPSASAETATVAAETPSVSAETPAGSVGDVEAGKNLATQCIGCHSVDGTTVVGPSWKGIYGEPVELEDGTTVVVDEAYLATSIKDPTSQIVKGFPPAMPPYSWLTDQQVADIIAYIETLKD